MKLLYTKRSPYARKVRVVAIEKSIALELIDENLMEKSEQLLKANPIGKIPTLILDSGESLTDSPVICEYLDGLKDNPILIPRTGIERMRALDGQALADGLMDVTVALYMEKVRHPKDFNQPFVMAQEQTVERTLIVFEKNASLFKKLSINSIALAAAIGYLNFRLGKLNLKGKYPNLQAWYEEFSKRPSMTQTIPMK